MSHADQLETILTGPTFQDMERKIHNVDKAILSVLFQTHIEDVSSFFYHALVVTCGPMLTPLARLQLYVDAQILFQMTNNDNNMKVKQGQ